MNILFTINDQYINHIELLIKSIINNNEGKHTFYFIYKQISNHNQNRLNSYCKKHNSNIYFKYFDDNCIAELPVNGNNWSIEIYYRLFACYILENVDKILYLDGDTLCVGNLSGLYNMDGVICACLNDNQEATERLHIKKYYNSGVLVMNLRKMRILYSREHLCWMLKENKSLLKFPDQDFINIIYKNYIQEFPNKYNYMISVAEINHNYKKTDFLLIHYVLEKPWNIKFPYLSDTPYLRILAQNGSYLKSFFLLITHRMYRVYQLLFVKPRYRRISWH